MEDAKPRDGLDESGSWVAPANTIATPETRAERDLRGGAPPWSTKLERAPPAPVHQNLTCDALVIGAGVTGSMVAQHLTHLGHDVCVIDRDRPGRCSTAASTAMLQWEIDCSMVELTGLYGFERASDIYIRSLRAVEGLRSLVRSLDLKCDFRDRNSLYIAGAEGAAAELQEEARLRTRVGLPSVYLDHSTLKSEFQFNRAAAILSQGCAEADPLALSHALLRASVTQGARTFDAEAVQYFDGGKTLGVALESGHVVECRHIVLATGYVLPSIVRTDLHRTASTWAMATVPQKPNDLWRDGALIWEASEPYLYARTTADHRIVVGGEDDETVIEPAERDGLTATKTKTIQSKLAQLCPWANVEPEFAWSGAFGETEDGLPLIGRLPGHPRILAAYGYGGNGITFSFLASQMIGRLITGGEEDWFEAFALDRPKPPAI